MPTWSAVLDNRPRRGEQSLSVSWGLQPRQPSRALPGWLMRVLGTVVEGAMRAVRDSRENLALRGALAFEVIRDESPGDVLASCEERAEALLRRLCIPPALSQDIEDVTVLIHRPPERVALPMNREQHLIPRPLGSWPGATAA